MERNLILLVGVLMVFSSYSCDHEKEVKSSSDTNTEVEVFQAKAISKSNSTKIYVHYMPWFETKASSENGQWSYHWTMGYSNPDVINTMGYHDIASHYHPLIGPYHSGDLDVIEYHLLLMKYAGIDGVLIDWYGTQLVNDYAMIHENSEQFIALIEKVGLQYAIVYEDRFLGNIVNAEKAPNLVEAAVADMDYLRENHFSQPNYIQKEQKPLLLVFGPITLQSPQEWNAVFERSDTDPFFLTLWNESGEAEGSTHGEFSWVYKDQSFLEQFYSKRVDELGFAIGSAYPGFEDYYTEAGVDTGINWEIPQLDGDTFQETLTLFANTSLEWLQLITWNDFGEGTNIEPTKEAGFRNIEILHDFAGVHLSIQVFENIHQLYELRKLHADDTEIQLMLDQAFYYMVSLQVENARSILNTIKSNF